MPGQTDPFQALAARLRDQGLHGPAAEIQDALDTAWTTSSERLGALGGILQRVEKAHGKDFSPGVRAQAAACRGEVRRVWPLMGRRAWAWAAFFAAAAMLAAFFWRAFSEI